MIAEKLFRVAQSERDASEDLYYHRPSSAGPEQCLRKLVYWASGVPPAPIPGRILHVFDDGDAHEEQAAKWIARAGYVVRNRNREVLISDPVTGYAIMGHVDGTIHKNGREWLWENKSAAHYGYERWAQGALPFDYLTQCALYMRGLWGGAPSSAILLIKDKDRSVYLEYSLSYEGDTLYVVESIDSDGRGRRYGVTIRDITAGAFNRFALIDRYVAEETLPPRGGQPDDMQCTYCRWSELCWGDFADQWREDRREFVPNFNDTVRYYKELGGQIGVINKEYEALRRLIKARIVEAGKPIETEEYICTTSKKLSRLTVRKRR